MSEWTHREKCHVPGIEEYWTLPLLGKFHVNVYIVHMFNFKPIPPRYVVQVCADGTVVTLVYEPLTRGLASAQARALDLAGEYVGELMAAVESAKARA